MKAKTTFTDHQIKPRELSQVPAFSSLASDQLERIAARMVRRCFSPGQIIFVEGDVSTGLWFILEGTVKIVKQSLSGRLQGLCLVNSGKCFGNCPLFDSDTNPADAQALTEVTLAVLPREELQYLIYNDQAVAVCLLGIYNERIALLARLGECLGTWPVSMRINDCLIAHAHNAAPYPIVSLTHEEISTLVGTAREVVTRHLAELEFADLIRTNTGHITLLDVEALKTYCSISIESE